MITSNQPVGSWGEMLGDEVVATAILDRLLHHSHILTIKGESYRLKEKRQAGIVPVKVGREALFLNCRKERGVFSRTPAE